MTTHTPFQLGSVSTGTLKTEDLLRAFADTLDRLRPDAQGVKDAREYLTIVRHNPAGGFSMKTEGVDEGPYIVDDLVNDLNELCPPFVYFGAKRPSHVYYPPRSNTACTSIAISRTTTTPTPARIAH